MGLTRIIKLKLFQRKFRKSNRHNHCFVMNLCDLSKVKIGNSSYGSFQLLDYSSSEFKVSIGSYCSIARNVLFLLGGEHKISGISTYPFKVKKFGFKTEAESKGDIVIKDDVWICEGATICSGVTVGQGAVIAAGAVVTKNVEPYSIVGGNPAKFIRYRFDEKIRNILLRINISDLFDLFTEDDLDLIYADLDEKILTQILTQKNISVKDI